MTEENSKQINELREKALRAAKVLLVKTLKKASDEGDETDYDEIADEIIELTDNLRVNSENVLAKRLETLYEYEKKYLELVKEYKEELKYLNTVQEDLRREYSGFFAKTLGDVTETLNKAQVDEKVAMEWLSKLEETYSNSIEVSRDLVETQVEKFVNVVRSRSENAKLNLTKENEE